MKQTVQMFYRSVYGYQRIYPANETAQRFADLMVVKTFSDTQLLRISELGFEIENVRDPQTVDRFSLIGA